MLFSTIAQPQLFLWMTLAGMVSALWYALLNALRQKTQAGALLSLCIDAIFAAGLAAVLIAFFLLGNYGKFRAFALLGAAAGGALCEWALLRPLKRLLGGLHARARRFMASLAKKRLFNIIFK